MGAGIHAGGESAMGGDMIAGAGTMDASGMMSGSGTMAGSEMHEGGHFMGLTMDMSAPLYIGLWAAMMVAIMFPTAAPMILTFARVQAGRRERGQVFVPAWLFTGSYIALWSATGLLAYGVAVGGDALAETSSWLMTNAARIGGVLLVAAGIYQLTPLKTVCLSKCRTPMSFILGSWRDGKAGAVRMGLEHGVYCLGCCWMLFAILFPLGMMNVAAMAVITAVIYAEKVFSWGRRIAQGAAIVLVAYGFLVILVPDALPTMM
jgi:predicted metal-binding membrane protein